MHKPVIALALAAAVLGAGAVYLLRPREPRAGMQAASAPRALVAGQQAREPRVAADAADSSTGPRLAGTRTEDPMLATRENHQDRQRRQAADFLRQYEDPVRRASLLELALDAARRSTAGLDQHLNLTPEQYDKLVQLIAGQAMDRRVAAARCIVDPACANPTPDSAVFSARDQDIRDIVGDEGLRALRTYRNAAGERRVVDGLQSRLAAGAALTDSQTADLTRALFDENQRQRRETFQSQQHAQRFGPPDGPSLNYADDAPTPELALQSGEASVQATRDRAATMLTGDQLDAFNRMYDELLISFRAHIRGKYSPRTPDDDHTP